MATFINTVHFDPDGETHDQIDHILTDKRGHWNVLDVRSFRAAECDTDHYLVVAKVRDRLSVSKRLAQKFDMGDLISRS